MMRPGPRNLITDVAGLRVGNASDPCLKSGTTVLLGETPFVAGVDVRGGAPGTRETDLLAPGRLVSDVDALVLSGGSAFGLDAASGVVDRLHAQGRGFGTRPGVHRVPIVPAAILFDLANGGAKDWDENPYRALGRAAFDAAALDFALGSEGAGTGAMTATLMGGLGSASIVTEEGATVGALVAVNAFGSVCPPGSRAFWGGLFEIAEEFGGLGAPGGPVPPFTPRPMKPGPLAGNTTLAIVATDVALDKAAAHRLAEVAQGGLARAIYPAHTPFDGDLVFGVATGRRAPSPEPLLEQLALAHAAALCLTRAVARGIHAARPAPGNLLPCWSELAG